MVDLPSRAPKQQSYSKQHKLTPSHLLSHTPQHKRIVIPLLTACSFESITANKQLQLRHQEFASIASLAHRNSGHGSGQDRAPKRHHGEHHALADLAPDDKKVLKDKGYCVRNAQHALLGMPECSYGHRCTFKHSHRDAAVADVLAKYGHKAK